MKVGQCSQRVAVGRIGLLLGGVVFLLFASLPVAAEERPSLDELCLHGAPLPEAGLESEAREYHQRRRELVHQVHETRLLDLESGLLDYDRVTGVLSVSGFREYPIPFSEKRISFRNGCILRFELEEARARDVITQLEMGTAQIEIGFVVAAYDDFALHYCPEVDGVAQLQVDLLYARLVDLDGGEEDRILGHYQTAEGHRWALRWSSLAVEAARIAIPEVTVSHFQWNPWTFSQEESLELREHRELISEQLERELFTCYAQSLRKNSSMQGAMVLEFQFSSAREPAILLDTLDHRELRACIEQRSSELIDNLSLKEQDGPEGFKVTILMRRR